MLVSEALQTSFLSDPGVVPAMFRQWEVIGASLIELLVMGGDMALGPRANIFVYLYILFIRYSFDLFMYGCKCIYINMNPNEPENL